MRKISNKSSWDKIVEYWKQNVSQNYKKLSALVGNMISALVATVLVTIQEGYDWRTAIILLILVLQPFFYLYINLVFKGETELKEQEILVLQQKLEYQQELAQYQILVAAKNGKVPDTVIAVHDWNELNRKLDELLEKKKGYEIASPEMYTNTDNTNVWHDKPDGTANGS